MRTLVIILALLVVSTRSAHAGYDVNELSKALNPFYPIWKINKKQITTEYGFQLLFNVNNTTEIIIPDFKHVLNGQSYFLLSCYGRIIPPAGNGYVVGTAIEGPTFGKIIIFGDNFKKIADIDSQKVVKMKLINLLNEDTLQIVTWEDHHYGTNTTRRVLNIYKISANKSIDRIFSHDTIDATFMPAGHEIQYRIDYRSRIRKKQIIIVNEDTGYKEVCGWNGAVYEGKNCQQPNPAAAE